MGQPVVPADFEDAAPVEFENVAVPVRAYGQ